MSRFHRGTVALKPENSLKRAEELIGVRLIVIEGLAWDLTAGFRRRRCLLFLSPAGHAVLFLLRPSLIIRYPRLHITPLFRLSLCNLSSISSYRSARSKARCRRFMTPSRTSATSVTGRRHSRMSCTSMSIWLWK